MSSEYNAGAAASFKLEMVKIVVGHPAASQWLFVKIAFSSC